MSFEDRTIRAENGCLDWTGRIDKCGYGRLGGVSAHRIAFERAFGPVPEGLEIDHTCHNRRCVEPSHLEAVTHRENIMRSNNFAAVNARKTHCVHGHEFNAANTYVHRGYRLCRTCNTAAQSRRWKRNREKAQ